ncbi:YSIRK-type signal peptide-containing protein [Enterococcus faecalis]|nr:YSIRK-type signal peptide-containing protein [Enterococcus faecalis]
MKTLYKCRVRSEKVVSKRNVLLRKRKYACKVQKYSIKKLSVGVASVLVGTALYLGNSVSAAEVTNTEVISNNNTALMEEPSGVATAEIEKESTVSEEVTAEKVNSELNRVADGDFEGSIVSNKSKWTMKPWGVSTIVTERNNIFGKINGETKDEYILQKISTTPGKNI